MTTRPLFGAALLLAAALPAAAASAAEWAVEERRTLSETIAFAEPGAGRRVQVNNLSGDIRVRAGDGPTVKMTAVETLRARSPEAAARGRAEVRLEIDASGGVVDLFVDGPFRSRTNRYEWARNQRDPGYLVSYDFELVVPVESDLDLRTVTGGDIEVVGVRGDFTLSNVNGGITLEGAAGSGSLTTVNGAIVAGFSENPDGDLELETVNGRIETRFLPDLSADLEVQSRWGEMWSEFEISPLPAPPTTVRRDDGRLVIRAGGSLVRIAEGGPRFSFKTLNGDILVHKARKVGTR